MGDALTKLGDNLAFDIDVRQGASSQEVPPSAAETCPVGTLGQPAKADASVAEQRARVDQAID